MNVQDEIARVTRYGEQIEALLDGRVLKLSGDRDALIIAYRSLLLDYHAATVTLLQKELYGAAFALQRPIVEALLRIHVAKIGSEETVLQLKNDTYRVDFSKVGAEIDKAFGLDFFAKSLDEEMRDALHGYTHSGSFQIARRFDESATKSRYSEGAILNAIEGSMTALFMATIVVTKHFGFEDEWRKATVLFAEYNKRPLEVPE